MIFCKKFNFLLFLSVLIYCLSSSNSIPGQIILDLNNNTRGDDLINFISSYSQFELVIDESHRYSERFNTHLFYYNQNLISDDDILERMRQDPNVHLAQFNYYIESLGNYPNDPLYPDQWALKNTSQIVNDIKGLSNADISFQYVWELLSLFQQEIIFDNDVVLAIADNGYAPNHPDINWYKGWNVITSNDSLYIGSHGTHVAGIAGAISNNNLGISGIARNIKILPVVTMMPISFGLPMDRGWGTVFWVIMAYQYVLEQRLDYNDIFIQGGEYIVAVNSSFGFISFGEYELDIMEYIIELMGQAGVMTIAAAGNSSGNNDLPENKMIPATIKSQYILSVSSTNNKDEFAINSNYGSNSVHLGSPGDYILSTINYYNGVGWYYESSGTSMAAPHVTGLIGLLYQIAPDDLLDEYEGNPSGLALLMKQYILDGVDRIPAMQDSTITGGRLNMLNPVQRILGDQIWITEDTIMSGEEFAINKMYVIDNEAILTITNSIINENQNQALNKFYGFQIRFGELKIISSEINLGNGSISISGENSFLLVQNSSIILDNGKIELVVDGSAAFYNSSLEINDTDIVMNHAQNIVFNNNSLFSMEGMSRIYGSAEGSLIDITEINDLSDRKDLIIIDNSRMILGEETEILSRTGNRFNGFVIIDSQPNIENDFTISSIASNLITEIHNFLFINSSVKFEDVMVENIGSFYAIESSLNFYDTTITSIHELYLTSNSKLYARNLVYEENAKGITLKNSIIDADELYILDNGSTGLIIDNSPSFNIGGSLNRDTIFQNRVYNAEINENAGSGLEVWQGTRVHLLDTIIQDNLEYGFYSLSEQQSVISGPSIISNNGSAEISAMYNAWVSFPNTLTHQTRPSAIDEVNSGGDDHYLLRIMGSYTPPLRPHINVSMLNVSKADLSRFYPCSDCFWFSEAHFEEKPGVSARGVYDGGLEAIEEEDYDVALLAFKSIVDEYPDTIYAIYSIALMPHLYNVLELDIEDFFDFLDISHPNLTIVIQHVTAMTKMFIEEYEEAIELFEEIIQDPVGELERLLAMKSQLFCIQKLTEQGKRSFPVASVGIPASYAEYRKMDEAIMKQIYSYLQCSEPKPPINTIPLETRLLSNFPNPFNPITNISFDLAVESIVSIDIFNIRGQRIRTLTNEFFLAGSHSIDWHGTDENGREVASGVYFYQMRTEGFSQVRRMMLLK
ncbi:MAG: S8 family serine peptidase [Candidatus Cloacimonetes bacterium]|nr:S8 family serine peptidase [Candidatus Cloacimonadota bacterium]